MEDVTRELAAELDATFFKVLGEPVRLELLKHLLVKGRQDVDSIASAFPQDRSVISRHLAALRDVGILRAEREGRFVHYQVNGRLIIEKLERLLARMREAVDICCPPPR